MKAYEFVTIWRVEAPIDRVWNDLSLEALGHVAEGRAPALNLLPTLLSPSSKPLLLNRCLLVEH